MQISSGWAKGLKLAAPAGEATRPTSAKVRAAVLNMLQAEIDAALVLDLFAGSGAVGIEAVSRGARGCVFVEKAAAAARCLAKNLDELRRRANSQGFSAGMLDVVGRDAGEALGKLERYGAFDLVFVDPPYRDAVKFLAMHAAGIATVMRAGGVLVVEADAQDEAGLVVVDAAGFEAVKRRSYGDTMISVWAKQGDGA